MASLVYFKFKSNLSFDTIQFDGSSISVRELRNAIRTKCSLRSNDYDLKMQDSNGKEFTNEDELISKYTSVIIRRVPKLNTEPQRKKIANPEDMTKRDVYKNQGAQSGLKFHQISKATNLASSNLPEDQKIKLMMEQASEEYTEKHYLVKPKPYGIPPATYVCRKCNTGGHWIHNCQGIKDKAGRPVDMKSVRRPTGIPQDLLLEVEAGTPGAYFAKSGRYVVPIKDAEAYALPKKEKRPFSKEENPPYVPKEEVVPESLKCPLCHKIFKDAVLVCCCCSTYCESCIMDYVFVKDGNTCPNCNSKISDNEASILENSAIRNLVLQWQSGNQNKLSKSGVHSEPVSVSPPKSIKEDTIKEEKVFVNNRRVLVPKASPAKLVESDETVSTLPSTTNNDVNFVSENDAPNVTSNKEESDSTTKIELVNVENHESTNDKSLNVIDNKEFTELGTSSVTTESSITITPKQETVECGKVVSLEVIQPDSNEESIVVEDRILPEVVTEEPAIQEEVTKQNNDVHDKLDYNEEDDFDSNAESVLNSELDEADDKVTVITKPQVEIDSAKNVRLATSKNDLDKRKLSPKSNNYVAVDNTILAKQVEGSSLTKTLSAPSMHIPFTSTSYQQALMSTSYATYSQNYYQQHGIPSTANPYGTGVNPYLQQTAYVHQVPFATAVVSNLPQVSSVPQYPVGQTYPGVLQQGSTVPIDSTTAPPFSNSQAPILSEEQFYLMKAKLLKKKRRSTSPESRKRRFVKRRSRSPREKWKPPKFRSRSRSPNLRYKHSTGRDSQSPTSTRLMVLSPPHRSDSSCAYRRSISRSPSQQDDLRWNQNQYSPHRDYTPRSSKRQHRRSDSRSVDRSPSFTPSPKHRSKISSRQPKEKFHREKRSPQSYGRVVEEIDERSKSTERGHKMSRDDKYDRADRNFRDDHDEKIDQRAFYKYMQQMQMGNFDSFANPHIFKTQYADEFDCREPSKSHHRGVIDKFDEPSTSSRQRRFDEILNDGSNGSGSSSRYSQDMEGINYKKRSSRPERTYKKVARKGHFEEEDWPSDGQDIRRVRKPVSQKIPRESKIVKKISSRNSHDKHSEKNISREKLSVIPRLKKDLSGSRESMKPQRSPASPTPSRSPSPVLVKSDNRESKQSRIHLIRSNSPEVTETDVLPVEEHLPIVTAEMKRNSKRDGRPRIKSNIQSPVKSSSRPQKSLRKKIFEPTVPSDNRSCSTNIEERSSQGSKQSSPALVDCQELSPSPMAKRQKKTKSERRSSQTSRRIGESHTIPKRKTAKLDDIRGNESHRSTARSTSFAGSQSDENFLYENEVIESKEELWSNDSDINSSPRNGPVSSKVLKVIPSMIPSKRNVEIDEDVEVKLQIESDNELSKKHKKKHKKNKKHKKHKKHKRRIEKDVDIE